MFSFIKRYILKLRISSEEVKHRSALTISIVLSIIILSLVFFLLRNSLFKINEEEKIENITSSMELEINSPWDSFLNFFKESKEQIYGKGSFFSDISETLLKIKENEFSEDLEE